MIYYENNNIFNRNRMDNADTSGCRFGKRNQYYRRDYFYNHIDFIGITSPHGIQELVKKKDKIKKHPVFIEVFSGHFAR